MENDIAELAFYDTKDNLLKGIPISNVDHGKENPQNAFDGNIRTNFNSNDPFWIGLDLGNPWQIGKIRYLFRNPFNTIEPGDTYELFYWDNEWKSLEVKEAKKDYLEFSVPVNTVLWLKNTTKGKEEMIFFIKNGIQVWKYGDNIDNHLSKESIFTNASVQENLTAIYYFDFVDRI